ncbi:MAG TPA: outer membrane beta-barrel protein, partial [Saprospiraceae bacterium]|nr:outer membrane beta-barrel protein [Saprospiraceae bacterium]
ALYLNFDPSSIFGITARGEYFDDKKSVAGFGTSLFDFTLSFDIKPVSNLIIIPEFRLDSAKDPIFFKNEDAPTIPTSKSAASFLLSAIVSF